MFYEEKSTMAWYGKEEMCWNFQKKNLIKEQQFTAWPENKLKSGSMKETIEE